MKQSLQTTEILNLRLAEQDIDPDALHIVKTLQRRNYVTYLVGGCVRDLLLDRHPKDFDIATLARPKDVRQAIHNAFIIGKRFRLVLVKRGDAQFEVSTFRRDPSPEDLAAEDAPLGDNLFGSPEEDARRRDFTINCLFYDPVKHILIDHANGLPDLKEGIVRMIGDPNIRLLEDPIRIMRGIRLAHMIRFRLDPDLREAIQTHASSLATTALPRRREELLKYLRLENPALPLLTSLDLGVLDYISPTLTEILRDTSKSEMFLKYMFSYHDKKLETPVELFAGLIVSYYLSYHHGVLSSELRSHDVLEDKKLMVLMRDELGMFKSEQMLVAKAMHLMTLFARRKEFESKGERRRAAMVSSEAFSLALKISEREHWLSPSDLDFWQKEYIRLRDPSRSSKPGSGRKRRRRPRKKPVAT
ncbi:MAG: poly(A) polymerase [Bdellovibrionales bacterium]|nr:poly(A) polymerase [Bdellovibrionales bacterium]